MYIKNRFITVKQTSSLIFPLFHRIYSVRGRELNFFDVHPFSIFKEYNFG
jgi:flagellar assembly factor FliW